MRARLVAGLVLLLSSPGCHSSGTPDEDFTDLAGQSPSSPAFAAKLKLAGYLGYGDQADVDYAVSPPYTGIQFIGASGDAIDVQVGFPGGETVAYLLDADFRTLAVNDGGSGADAHIAVTLPPASAPLGTNLYTIAFQNVAQADAAMKLVLAGPTGLDLLAARTTLAESSTTLGPWGMGQLPAGARVLCLDTYVHPAPGQPWVWNGGRCGTYLAVDGCDIDWMECFTTGGCKIDRPPGASQPYVPVCFDLTPKSGGGLDIPDDYDDESSLAVTTFDGWRSATPACCDANPDECQDPEIPLPAVSCGPDTTLSSIEAAEGAQSNITHKIVGKSFIGPITLEPQDQDLDQMTGMKAAFSLNENPLDDAPLTAPGLNYRMRTEMTVTIACNGNNLVGSSIASNPSMGYEPLPGLGWTPGVAVDERAFGLTETTSCATFEADIGGHPAPPAACGAGLAYDYELRIIRHQTRATICCDGTPPTYSITGTQFPSHRLFVDGNVVDTVVQGPLETLEQIDNPSWGPLQNGAFQSGEWWRAQAAQQCCQLGVFYAPGIQNLCNFQPEMPLSQ